MYNAEVIDRLEKAGLVIIGKTNMDEFAMGSTTETSAYGETKNPWNTEHVPGGSSGGSCAAVAAEECSFALGSDTGRFHPSAEFFLRRNRYQTDIRNSFPLWTDRLWFFSGSDRTGGKDVTDCATILEAITSYDKRILLRKEMIPILLLHWWTMSKACVSVSRKIILGKV